MFCFIRPSSENVGVTIVKTCLIVGGGPVDAGQLAAELQANPELVIAADRGGAYLWQAGRIPDVLVGDWDSLPREFLSRVAAGGSAIRRFPTAKDQTDLELALDAAVEGGCGELRVLGGLGGRLDHTLGNIGLLLKALRQGLSAYLIDPDHIVTIIDREITLRAKPGWAVSLVPLTPVVSGVTTTGLAFPLNAEDLFVDATRGLHNEFNAPEATVGLRDGLLTVVLFRED